MEQQNDKTAAEVLARMLIHWQQQLMLRQTPHPSVTNLIARRMNRAIQTRLRPRISLEVGAREASYSLEMRGLFPNMLVTAFEASPISFEHFSKETDFHGKGIEYLNMAVSDEDGTVNFNLIAEDNALSGRNSIMLREDLESISTPVRCVRGDSFLAAKPKGDAALWIDVEGAAEKVLKGFEESFRTQRISSIFIEVEEYAAWQGQWLVDDVIRYLLGFGYVPVFCDKEYDGLFADGALSQYNVIFARLADAQALLPFITEFYFDTVASMVIEPAE